MDNLADIVARYAPLWLCAATILLLMGAAVFWRLLYKYGRACMRFAGKVARDLAAMDLPVLGRPLSGAISAVRVVGVLALLALTFAVFALVAFVELADEIGADESLGRFDIELAAALREHISHGTLRFFSVITHLGDAALLIWLGIIVAGVLLVLRHRMLAAVWAVATLGGALLNRLLKALFERTRPLHDHGLASESSWSFPSGHASGSMLVYGLLGYLVIRHAPGVWHIPVALVSAVLIILVGSSRVLLQVHYLSDVLAGYVTGALCVALSVSVLEVIRWRGSRGGEAV